MACNICGEEMEVIAKGNSYTYYSCPHCKWYSTSENQKGGDAFSYDKYETFDCIGNNYEKYVNDSKILLKHKFNMIGRNYIPQSFLDVGCSEGVWVDTYKRNFGGESAGVEVSKDKIQRGKERGLNVGTFDEISGKYQFVLCRHVVEHIENPKEFIDNILEKYVSDGGFLFVETPNNDSEGCIKEGNVIKEDRFLRQLYPPTHVCGFTVDTFKIWLGEKVYKIGTYSYGDRKFMYDVKKNNFFREVLNKYKSRKRSKKDMEDNIFVIIRK